MAQRSVQRDVLLSRSDPDSEPVTEYNSKMIMLRAERHDEIEISEVVEEISPLQSIPKTCSVKQRTNTYYGPKLVLKNGNSDFMLTAPGPDANLLLWGTKANSDGFRQSWQKIAEVKVTFSDEQPQYDLCPYCREPLQTLEHERESAVGQCSRAD